MSKITGSFLVLVFIIIFSSIVYIWQAESEKEELEAQITTQQEKIATLESQLQNQPSPADTIVTGEVLGEVTPTGTITGSVTLSQLPTTEAVIICAVETRTKQETCTDFILEPTKKEYAFSFDIPQGQYEVYAVLPPVETKTYYSEIKTCDTSGDCTSDVEQKRLLQVNTGETQSDIVISL